MVYTDPNEIGHLPTSPKPSSLSDPIETYRARVNVGLRRRAIGRWTFQVTGGDDAADTFDFTVGGVSILSAPVAWTTNHNTTAAAIATAINANAANNNYFATVSTDTVTIRQRKSGAVTITKVVVGDAAGTLTAAFASTDTWTEFVSGATLDGDEYYELSWSGALLTIQGVDTDNARAVDLDFYCDGQAVTFFTEIRTASNAIVQGLPLATATWLHATYGAPWPFFDRNIPFIIKLAADEELLYTVGII